MFRIPKSGSTLLLSLLYRLGERLGYLVLRHEEEIPFLTLNRFWGELKEPIWKYGTDLGFLELHITI
jgi:hypothetical protein